MQCSAALGRVGKVGRVGKAGRVGRYGRVGRLGRVGMVGRVGRVARVNAGRTAVATGDREGLQCTHWSGFTAASRQSTFGWFPQQIQQDVQSRSGCLSLQTNISTHTDRGAHTKNTHTEALE